MLFDVVTVREATTLVEKEVVPTPSRWRSFEKEMHPKQEVEGVNRLEVLPVFSQAL